VTVTGAWVWLGETLTSTQVGGIACALISVVLLSQEAAQDETK